MQHLTTDKMKENENVTNLAGLKEMMGGKKHLVKEIIDVFLKQVPDELSGLNNAINNMDYPAIKSIAHTMMSTVSIVGASELAPILFELESLGTKATDIERIKNIHKKVITLCDKAIKELESEVHNYA